MISTGSRFLIFNPGKVIKRYRKDLKLTLRDAALRLELNHSFLNKIEEGERKPALDTLLLIGRVYQIPFNTLIRLAESYGIHISTAVYTPEDGRAEAKTTKSKNTEGEEVEITWTIVRVNR